MKANPGGPLKSDAILGREVEINEIWSSLEKQSVILNAERRVGKTCLLRKMYDHPQNNWIPLLCFVENANHPIDFIQALFAEAEKKEAQSNKGKWLNKIRNLSQSMSGVEFQGFKIPSLREYWKQLLNQLVEDITINTDNNILIMIDEFPMMISNIVDSSKDQGAKIAMEFLNTLRALRQQYHTTDQIRFILSGSIGLHLILEDFERNHDYKGKPINDMKLKILAGMRKKDVQLMCRKYLEEENIIRNNPTKFDDRMFKSTDGLPLYIQYVCERFQEQKKEHVSPADIDKELREMMDNREIPWFQNAADRIDNYYSKLGENHKARLILKKLSHEEDFINEKVILDYLKTHIELEYNDDILTTLELLLDDNYLVRDTTTGVRRYRFQYDLMRRWWKINRG